MRATRPPAPARWASSRPASIFHKCRLIANRNRTFRFALSREPGGDLAQRRSRPIGNRPRRRSDMNEAGYAFVRRQAKSIEHGAIISVPPGDPIRPIVERMRGEDQVHGGGAG